MFHIARLAFRDYFHEWQISGCFVLALSAVLGPMLVLFGLKFGIVGNMLDQLIEDPRNREIRPVSSRHYELDWFSKLQKRDDVEFVIPRIRNLASNMRLKSKTAKRMLDVELIPTAENDPLLVDLKQPPANPYALILSHSAAKKLAVQRGDTIKGSISRRYKRRVQRVSVTLKVQAIANETAFEREGAFCSLALLEALESYRDGHAVPEFGWNGSKPEKTQYYTGFRLFTRTINDVATLKTWMNSQGIEVRTQIHGIQIVKRLEKNLTTIYWVIALISLTGFAMSLGASLWANIDRKRKELCVLRLVGFTTGEILWFPIVQSLITAVLGWGLAVVICYFSSLAINQYMQDQLEPGQQVCVFLPIHYLYALALTCFTAFIAALLAGFRSARLEPSEGLREL